MQNKHHQVHQRSTDRDVSQPNVDEDALGIPQKVIRVRLSPVTQTQALLTPTKGLRNPRLK